jgi:hypothetical protein
MYTLDVSDPTRPVLLSDTLVTNDAVNGLWYSTGRLYIAAGSVGLEIWDVSTPASPVLLGQISLSSPALDVVVAGDHAYVARADIAADSGAGLSVVDVSNPGQPREVGHCVLPAFPYGVSVQDSYAYASLVDVWPHRYSGLSVVKVSSPQTPTEIGRCATPGWGYGVNTAGNYAYVADYGYGLRVIDVSNRESLKEVGNWDDTSGFAYGVATTGNYVHVADYGLGLRVIDVSNPQKPREVGHYATPGSACKVAASGGYDYVADESGLEIIQFYGAGVEEGKRLPAQCSRLTATVVRGVLTMPLTANRLPLTASLLDISGRKVMTVHSGANDVSHLAPGVYFVWSATTPSLPAMSETWHSTYKVITTK